ncbi:MAG TPA: C25 family cysteine peptidase [Thermoanaerobaculia bacterium]|jgi:subtilisin-like proprotein convertase family protein|nr:C25 family cysteine peptidase [Thermoanaerobaculia bacterium]
MSIQFVPFAISRRLTFATAVALGASGFLFIAGPVVALTYTYTNTTTGTVNFSAAAAGAAGCATPLVRTFAVADSFTVSQVGLGFNLDHVNRGDIRITLVAPGGTSLQLIAGTAGAGGDADDNFDILLSSNTEGALDDADTDPTAAPFFNRLVAVANIDTTFAGVASSGTWTLNICDINNNATNATFNRAYLILASSTAAVATCTGTVTFDWGANGNAVAFTNTTVGDLTVTQGATSDFAGTGASAAGTLGNEIVTRTTTNGNHAGYYSMSMDATALAGTQDNEVVGLVSTLNFSRPVRDLRFTFLDVDITAASWEDQIELVATGPAGNRVPYTITPVAGATTQVAGDLAEGDTASANTATNGNLDVVVSGAVSSLTLNYTQGSDPANENVFMVVGIGDFSFCGYDYGDAPNSYGTQLAGGARHAVGDRTLYLGTNPPDGEANGQPAVAGAAATTDDTTQVGGLDDEDGVASFPAYASPATSYTVSVTAVNLSATLAGSLVGYIDWNRDGDFADANEISGTVSVPANTLSPTAFNVTWSAVPTNAGGTTATYARFRISYTAAEVTTPTGVATSGEVEDYQIPVNTLPVTLASFSAVRTTRGVDVEWTTETETSTVGYALLGRKGAKGPWQPLTPKLVPARSLDRLAPQSYRIVLADAGWSELLLEDAGVDGERTRHGPFALDRPYGRAPTAEPIAWANVRAEIAASAEEERRAISRVARPPSAELRVALDGLYRVTYEDLRAAGIDFAGVSADRLSLEIARSGKGVPIYVRGTEKSAGDFGPGAFLEFRGEAVADSLYTRSRVYRLTARSAGRPSRVQVEDGTPQGAGVASYPETLAVDRDLVYSFASPNGDPWYEAPVLAQGSPAAKSFALEADALAGTEARLHVDLWGVTNWPSTPDHHLQISLNGTQLVDERFDGLVARSFDLALPPGVLFEGTNSLEVRLPGDTGNAFDLIHVDRYALTYPRRFVARGDRLSFPAAPGREEVSGLSTHDVVVYAKGGATRLTNVAIDNAGVAFRAAFSVPGAGLERNSGPIDLSTPAAMLRPAIQPAREVPADLGLRRADYLIVTHPSLAAELAPLIAARESEGHRVKVVDVLDLYASYSGGEIDPQAIRSYVRYAAERLGARYLLLVGADSYDYLDHLGIGSVSLIPTPYVQTDDLIHFTPSDSVYGDLDGDGVQDLALGRFPARTASELRQLIAKTLTFGAERTGALFAADATDDEGARTFSSISDQLISQVPAAWPLGRAYVDDLGIAAARSALIAAFNQGPGLVHFVGHSGPTVWSFQGLFSAADGDALTNVGRPSVVVQWGCWNTYHVAPEVDTLAHRLLLAGPQGAAAVIGSATLSRTESDQLLGPALLARLMVPGATLGDALVQAKRAIAVGGDLRDALLGWTLLGDPALRLRP